MMSLIDTGVALPLVVIVLVFDDVWTGVVAPLVPRIPMPIPRPSDDTPGVLVPVIPDTPVAVEVIVPRLEPNADVD